MPFIKLTFIIGIHSVKKLLYLSCLVFIAACTTTPAPLNPPVLTNEIPLALPPITHRKIPDLLLTEPSKKTPIVNHQKMKKSHPVSKIKIIPQMCTAAPVVKTNSPAVIQPTHVQKTAIKLSPIFSLNKSIPPKRVVKDLVKSH
jgi:hypothetical protein